MTLSISISTSAKIPFFQPLHPGLTTHRIMQVGKGRVRRVGKDVAIVGYGHSVLECMAAAEMLEKVSPSPAPALKTIACLSNLSSFAYPFQAGVSATVVDARFCKPLDTQLVRQLAQEHPAMITVEEGSIGGFAAHVMQFLALEGLLDGNLKFRPMTLPDRYIEHGTQASFRVIVLLISMCCAIEKTLTRLEFSLFAGGAAGGGGLDGVPHCGDCPGDAGTKEGRSSA